MAIEAVSTPGAVQDYQHPHDLEAEGCLLGSLLLDNSVIADIHELIKKDCFYNSHHQLIYEAILKLYDERVPVDEVTLKNELEKRGPNILEKIGGASYLITLSESVPSAGNAIYYAKIIREKYIQRRVMEACYNILHEASQSSQSSEVLLDKAEQVIFDVARQKEIVESIRIPDILRDVYERITLAHERKGRLSGLPTGLIELDNLLGGLQAGQFIVVAGRPGSGKSSFALRLLEESGLKEKKPIILFTMEVTSQQVVQNLLCSHAHVNSHLLRRGAISNEDIQKLLTAANAFHTTPILVDDSVALTPFDLRTKARRLKSDYDIQLVIVDYLQLMMMKDADNREREIATISYSLKNLAKELNIPVVAMAQLSRAAEHREPKQSKPKLSDLRESGAIEQDADVVLLLYRDELHNPDSEHQNICEIHIAKQRNGPTGMVKVSFLKEFTRFENLYREEQE